MKSSLRIVSPVILAFTLAAFAAAQTPQENAWTVLNGGLTHKSTDKRVRAVGVLGELIHDGKAEDAALTALKDDKDEVRAAAAQSLGDMGAKSAIPQLHDMINDKEPSVILAAAHALIALGDDSGYNVYYAVLTGEQKTGTSLTDQQKKMLKDPKKMANLGFQAGLGFVPFGGVAYGGFKLLTRDDTSPVLAAAALILAKDPDPKSGQALADAATQKEKWLVRAAAFDALAKRGDPSLLHVCVDGLTDEKEEVQYSAAGAVLRLSDIEAERKTHPKPQAKQRKPAAKKSQ
jgi:HEAT repeat protein